MIWNDGRKIDMVFKNEYTIGLEDIGLNCKATNKTILAIMEDIGSLHSGSVGYGVTDIETTKEAWVILDWKVRIIRRPEYNEKIQACTWACGMNRLFALRDFELKDEAGNTIVIGSSRWILINIETRRPERLKPELADMFGAEVDHHIFPEGDPDFKDIPDVSEIMSDTTDNIVYEYQVERRDIDTNGHMHNLNYLEVAYEALPLEVYNKEECNNIRIVYKKEIMYGQKVKCEYTKKEDKNYVIMSNGDHINAIVLLEE